MPNQDQSLEFPSKGLDISREIRQQPDKTTADCQNVASRDSILLRDRGGSRPGFSKYVDDQGSAGAVNVQMLEVLIDPTTDALIQNFETPDPDWVPHPRFPGILIPPRGAPWTPNPNAEQPADITFIQEGDAQVDATGPIQVSATLPSNPTTNNTIIVFVATESNAVGTTVSVVNNGGTALTQEGAYSEQEQLSGSGVFISLSCWIRRVTGVNDKTIKVTPSADAGVSIAILEYKKITATSPLDDHAETQDPSLSPPNMSSGSLLIHANGDMAIVAFANGGDSTVGWTVGTGQNDRVNLHEGLGPSLRITDKLPVATTDSPLTLTGSVNGGDTPYVSFGATFKKG